MIGPNLSEWAIKSRQLTIYMMIVAVIAGAFAFVNLGRDEDPTFTIKTMLVTAVWPGATMEETQTQLTDRLERKLEETTGLDALRSITRPGIVTIYVDLEGAFPPDRVQEVWQEVRNGIGDIRHTLPQGVLGPFFNDNFGDVFGIIYGFTADGFSDRELRDNVDVVRSELLRQVDGYQQDRMDRRAGRTGPDRVPARPRRGDGARLRPDLQRHRRTERGASFGRDQHGHGEPGAARVGRLRVRGRRAGGHAGRERPHDPAGRHRRRCGAPSSIRRSRLLRINGERAIALAISMSEGGDILELGESVTTGDGRIIADLPVGIEPILISNQPEVVDLAIGDFTTSLWQAVGIILFVSFLSLGVRPGCGGGHRDSGDAGGRVPGDADPADRPAPGVARGLDHRAGIAGG